MKKKIILAIILSAFCFGQSAFSQIHNYNNEGSLPDKNYLNLTPDFGKATLDEDYATIPFTVKNNYTKDIVIAETWDEIDGLMTLNDSGQKVLIECLRGPGISGGGPLPTEVVLRPGESRAYKSEYPMKLLASVANKKIFGVITGRIADTNETFHSYSAPFFVPPSLTAPPWIDLGEQKYFSMLPDLAHSVFTGGPLSSSPLIGDSNNARLSESGWADSLGVLVKITNTAVEPYIAATDSLSFYIVKQNATKQVPFPWEIIKATGPILKPGESASAVGRFGIRMDYLESHGYKQGDKLIAAVGGRIPNTNQIFECYSAPFVLPPLPKSHPPK